MKSSLLLLLPFVALAQLTPNSVTVTASRNAIAPSDLIVFNVTLTAASDVSFEDVLAAASGAGLTAANFRGVNLLSGSASWLFALTAPLNDTKATVALLNALQQSFAKDKKFSLSFQVGGTDVSAQALQKQSCSLADLMTDARTRAANLAAASGATAGAIQMLTASTWDCSITVRYALGGVGQTAPGAISVAAQGTPVNTAPTRVAINVTVSADVSVALDNVVQTVSALGISAADLVSVSQPFIGRVCIAAPCNPIEWIFRYSAPLSSWKDTLAKLAQVQAAKHPGITISYYVSADTPPTPDCALPTLVSQARKRAQDVAAAAGVSLGALNAVSDGSPAVTVPTEVVRSGSIIGNFAPISDVGISGVAIGQVGSFISFVAPAPSACSATAQFAIAP